MRSDLRDALSSIHARMEGGAVTERTPTVLGLYILRKMGEHRPALTQTTLAQRSGLAQASVSRYIYAAGRPDTDKLGQLAEGLAGGDAGDQEEIYQQLLTLAGHGLPGEVVPDVAPVHRYAREVDTMLSDGSPIPEDKRKILEGALDQMLEYWRPLMRRRRNHA